MPELLYVRVEGSFSGACVSYSVHNSNRAAAGLVAAAVVIIRDRVA